MENNQPQAKPEKRTISVKLSIDDLTDTMIVDKEKGVNVLLVAIPLSVPKLTALGFLWCVMDNLTTFYKHAEAVHARNQSGGIVKATMKDAMARGKNLLKS